MKKNFKRIVLIILDGCGVGVQDDYKKFHSKETNTIGNLYKTDSSFSLSFLESLGLKQILSLNCSVPVNNKKCFKLKQLTSGNDTFAGMWEMFGVVFKKRFASNGRGLGKELLNKLRKNNLSTICNRFISGYKALDRYYVKHKETGLPILYSSNDGVILLAAHTTVMAPEKLNQYAKKISPFLFDKGFVRIITRPFTGLPNNFVRIEKFRKDFMLVKLPRKNMLGKIQSRGVNIRITEHINRIFHNPEGVSVLKKSYSNNCELTGFIEKDLANDKFNLLIYVLPDTDNLGHKKNVSGFRDSMVLTDKWLEKVSNNLGDDDLLIISADHGCDPSVKLRGHCREFIPLLFYSHDSIAHEFFKTSSRFSDIGEMICRNFKVPFKRNELS